MATETEITSLHVSLPKSQREFVEAEATRAGCTTTSEYVRRLIADAQERAGQEKLERLLIEGLESGPAAPLDKEFFNNLRSYIKTARTKKSK